MGTYTVQLLTDHLLQFDDPITATCYLLLGDEKNLMIDTGSGDPEEFRQLLLPYRDKPLVLAITHAHADHYANAGIPGLFMAAFMHPKDIAILPEMNEHIVFAMAEQGRALLPEMLTPLREDQEFDLGGVHVRTLPLPGHSPGSVCFYMRRGAAVLPGRSGQRRQPGAISLKSNVRFREVYEPTLLGGTLTLELEGQKLTEEDWGEEEMERKYRKNKALRHDREWSQRRASSFGLPFLQYAGRFLLTSHQPHVIFIITAVFAHKAGFGIVTAKRIRKTACLGRES